MMAFLRQVAGTSGVAVARQMISLIPDHDEDYCHMCQTGSVNEDTAVIRFGDPEEEDPCGVRELR